MIEIKCTKAQKEKIISVLETMPIECLFPAKAKTCFLMQENSCKKCLETKIKWDVERKLNKVQHG